MHEMVEARVEIPDKPTAEDASMFQEAKMRVKKARKPKRAEV